MGATTFITGHSATESTPLDRAFADAVQAATVEHGNRGYTGSLAEKSKVVLITETRLTEDNARRLARELLQNADPRVDDKHGPAGALRVIDQDGAFRGWLFFGWAST